MTNRVPPGRIAYDDADDDVRRRISRAYTGGARDTGGAEGKGAATRTHGSARCPACTPFTPRRIRRSTRDCSLAAAWVSCCAASARRWPRTGC